MTNRQEKTTFGELVDNAARRFGAKEALYYQLVAANPDD